MGYEILGNLTFNKFHSRSRNHDDIIIFQLQGSLLYQLVFHYKVNETSAYSSHQKSKFDDSSKINWNPFSNTFILQSKNFSLLEVRMFLMIVKIDILSSSELLLVTIERFWSVCS